MASESQTAANTAITPSTTGEISQSALHKIIHSLAKYRCGLLQICL
jgi:hypothetical protein